MRTKRFYRFKNRHWELHLGSRLTWVVIALQSAMLLTLWVTPTWQPPRVRLFELVWAWMHQPTFYPVAALIVVGPIASVMAWSCRGKHMRWLLLSWVIFIAILIECFSQRVAAMTRVLWWLIAG